MINSEINKGICTVSVAPIRASISHQSEMISQLLYGETIDIQEIKGDFAKIKVHFDAYEGWISTNQISLVADENSLKIDPQIVTETFIIANLPEGKMLLSMGSEIRLKSDKSFTKPDLENIAETAKQFLNVPYLWSGRSFFGVDCSGFVQLVYKIHGLSLPRDAYQQAEIGDVLSFVEEAKPGDLAFFENEEGKITHVGMMLEDQKIIHAYGKVRIDDLDSSGIFNNDLKKHTHKLRFIRSIF